MLVSAEISLTQTQGKEKRFRGSKTTEKIIILGKLCIFLRKTSWKSVDFLFLNCAGLPHEAWCFDSQIHGEVVTMLTESMSLLFHGHPCGLISKLHSFNKPHWTMHYSYSLSSITGSLSLPIWQNHDYSYEEDWNEWFFIVFLKNISNPSRFITRLTTE